MENEDTVSLEDEKKDEEISDEEETTETESEKEEEEEKPDLSAELKEAQAEAAKWRRLAEKNAKAKVEVEREKVKVKDDSLSADEVDIKILQSQGLDDESVEYLKKLAQVNSTSLLAAQSDPIYTTFKEKHDKEKKSKDASLGVSKGSGTVKKGKTFQTPGLTDEDHKDMWREQKEKS